MGLNLPAVYGAMALYAPNTPLRWVELPLQPPKAHELLIEVEACGICRTDLHILWGELPMLHVPVVPGHEVVGRVVAVGDGVQRFSPGDRVGVPWLGRTCGRCRFCRQGKENLCEEARFTGYHLQGGFAQYLLAHEDYSFTIPHDYPPDHAAPLLCAGLIGYRSYRRVRHCTAIGIYGFGAAAHIITQVASRHGKEIYAFTRPGDEKGWEFAHRMGAVWAGGSDQSPPRPLEAAIIFAPVGELVVKALKDVDKGGTVVCAGIYMTPVPSFPYELLWGEREICSIANLTREDGEEFFSLAAEMAIKTSVQPYPLREANEAVDALKKGKIKGAAVLTP